MQRRKFLKASGCSLLGMGLLPMLASGQRAHAAFAQKRTAADQSLIAELEKLVPALMSEAVVPGVSIALVKDAKLLWRGAFGVKDSVSKEPVDDDTVFEAASISKTVFAYAVVKLCEKGMLNLDAPLSRYLPTRFLEGDPRLDLITARHVLSHTSGFQDFRSRAEPLKIHFTPGERFLYSGEGYFYLQSVVTQLAGRVNRSECAKYEAGLEVCATDIDSYLRKNLLAPLGMANSGYVWNEHFAKHAAHPHGVDGKPFTKPKPTATDAARYAAPGGLLTTPTEYAKFLIEVVNPKPEDAFRLSQKSLDDMLRPHIKLPDDQKIDGADSWALGWAIQNRNTGKVILHSGGQAGFRTLTMASAKRKSGFVIFTNSDNGGKIFAHPAFEKMMNRLLDGPE